MFVLSYRTDDGAGPPSLTRDALRMEPIFIADNAVESVQFYRTSTRVLGPVAYTLESKMLWHLSFQINCFICWLLN